jgi:tRNA threonylcarbamoyladenosine modification (KEOPS) complex  Pcc1 subunit
MKSSTSITLYCDALEAKMVLELFESEDKLLSNNRALYTITNLPDGLLFTITADDCVALRAMLSSISKTLSIFEKTKSLVHQE